MEKVLGEPINANELSKGDLFWYNGAFRPVTGVRFSDKAGNVIEVDTVDAGTVHLLDDELVLRGGRFLVARRVK